MNLTQCGCVKPHSTKAVQALGQYFDFGSFASFFSSGFGQTLTNLATTVASTEIKSALGPSAPAPVTAPAAPRPVLPTQYPAPTGTAGAIATLPLPAPLPVQPNIPGTIPGSYPANAFTPGLNPTQTPGLTPSQTAQTAGQLVPGINNIVLLGGAALLILVILKK